MSSCNCLMLVIRDARLSLLLLICHTQCEVSERRWETRPEPWHCSIRRGRTSRALEGPPRKSGGKPSGILEASVE